MVRARRIKIELSYPNGRRQETMRYHIAKEDFARCTRELSILDGAVRSFLIKGYDCATTKGELRSLLRKIRHRARAIEATLESINWSHLRIQETIPWEALEASVKLAQSKQP